MEKFTGCLNQNGRSCRQTGGRCGRSTFPSISLLAWLKVAVIIAVLAVPLGAGAASVSLPKTGQTLCYDEAGFAMSCAGTGQDGELQLGAPWPNPRFIDNLDGTITDTLSGLIWLKDASCSDIQPSGGSDWPTALSAAGSLHNGQCRLSDGSAPGDWRLPNVNELESLVDLSNFGPALPDLHPFINVLSSGHWASTVIALYPGNAEHVAFENGCVRGDVKTTHKLVWPVRGTSNLPKTGQNACWDINGAPIACSGTGADGEKQTGVAWPLPRFVDNGNGTLTDLLTRLVWLQNADCFGDTVSQSAALLAAKTLASGACNLTDGSSPGDWRLPNRKEMRSLPNYEQTNGGAWLSSQGFSNGRDGYYWSSDAYSGRVDAAWLPAGADPNLGDKWMVNTKGGAWLSSWVTAYLPVQTKYLLPVRGPVTGAASYLITASAGAGGTVSPAGTATVSAGASQTYSIAANGGFHISGVLIDGAAVGSVSSYTFNNVAANHTLSAMFSQNTGSANIPQTGWSLKYVDSQELIGQNGAATNAFDGRPDKTWLIWHTQWYNVTAPPCPHEIQINLGNSYNIDSFSYLPRQDGGINGTISQYEFYVSGDGVNWGTPVAAGTFAKDTTLKQVSLAAKTGQYIRLRALSEINGGPWTSVAQITVTGTSAGTGTTYSISASAGTGGTIAPAGTVTVNSGATQSYSITANSGFSISGVSVDGASVGKLSSYTFSNVAANHTISATFSANTTSSNIPQTGWSLKFVDSQELVGQNGAATNAFDGQPDKTWLIWHTQWYNVAAPPCPHEIQINLGKSYSIDSFSYLPRQDGGINGTIGQYEFYISSDGVNWGTPVATGTFAKDTTVKRVNLAATTGQYIRLRALTEINGGPWTSAAQITLTGK